METVKVVKDPEQDPKSGKPRARSGVSFPYWDLASVIEVATVIHERAGGVADTAQLATMLNYSGISNGSFRTRVSAAKMFGVIESTDDGRLRVSTRGRQIVAPFTPAEGRNARVEAFLAIDLFKRVFDRFKGTTLPERVGLRNLFLNEYTMVQDRVGPTVRILLNSADQAGMFEAAGNRTRMALPLGVDSSPAVAVPKAQETTDEPESPKNGGGNGNGGNGNEGGGGGGFNTDGIDPAILGLLKRLPPGGTVMTAKRRKQFIDAFTNVVSFIYPDSDDPQ